MLATLLLAILYLQYLPWNYWHVYFAFLAGFPLILSFTKHPSIHLKECKLFSHHPSVFTIQETVSKSSPTHQSYTSLTNVTGLNLVLVGRNMKVGVDCLWWVGKGDETFKTLLKKNREGIITTMFVFHLNTSYYVSVHCSRLGVKES